MYRIARLCLLPLVPLILTDSLAWSPDEGATLTKTFRNEGSGELTDFMVVVDGEDMSAMAGDLWVESVSELTVVVTDEYLAVDEGEVRRFRRTYDTIDMSTDFEMTIAGATTAQETPASSELEGATVTFQWEQEAEEWQKSFDEESEVTPDEELLEGLVADMDLRFLLPSETVAEGDTWEVGLVELLPLIQPGGNVGLMPSEMEDIGIDMDRMTELIEDAQERFTEEAANWGDGGILCTYRGARDEERGTIGVVDLELDITLDADLTDLLSDLLAVMLEEFALPIEIEILAAMMDGSSTGSGEMQWNIDTGQLDGLSFDATYEFSFEFEVEGGDGTQSSTVEASLAMEGAQLYEATTE